MYVVSDLGQNKKNNIKDFNIIQINKLEEINKIKSDWLSLIEKSGERNMYVDPDFFKHLFHSRAGEAVPNIILFKQNELPVAIVIGWTKKIKIPLRLGYFKLHTPFLSCFEIEIGGLLTNGEENSKSVIDSYLSSLLKRKETELLLVDHLYSSNKLWEEIINGLSIKRNPVFKLGITWYAKIKDNETGEKIKLFSSKTASKFRRKARRLKEYFNQELDIVTLDKPGQIDRFLINADMIGKKSYQYALDVGVKNNDFWKEMLSAFARLGYFKGYLLMNNEKPIAYILGVQYKNIFYQYATAYNDEYKRYSLGEYLRLKVLEQLDNQEIYYVDYGYGDAAYKRMFGTDSLKEATFRIYGFSFNARLSKFLDKLTTALSENILSILEKAGIVDKIKKLWRRRLISDR